MNNQALQYVRGIFLRNDIVYIDASALMNFDELRRFLEKYGSIIRETGTVIIIPAAVRCEIASFLGSEDEDKDHKALECIDVLDKYRDLFELEGGDLSDVDYENVFADPCHLAALILGGASLHQLLITNDVALSQDSYSMNNLKSCRGLHISVCIIDLNGDLQKGKSDDRGCEHRDVIKGIQHSKPTKTDTVREESSNADHKADPIPEQESSEDNTCRQSVAETQPSGVPVPIFVVGLIAAGIVGSEVQKHKSDIVSAYRRIAAVI